MSNLPRSRGNSHVFARNLAKSDVAHILQSLLEEPAVDIHRQRANSPNFNLGPNLDLKQIKQIIELMKRAELSEFAVEDEGFKLKIRRGGVPNSGATRNSNPPFDEAAHTALATPVPSGSPTPVIAPQAEEQVETGVIYIKSPMVGTFYRSPSPESKSFAEIGTPVSESTAVCIIEAMKIMNEIQAEVKGTIVEALVEDGDPVEYGQKLFKVKSS